MSEENKNFDSILEKGITLSLEENAPEGFTSALFSKIALEKEFSIEDNKTSKLAKYIVSGFLSLMLVFVVMFTVVFNSNESSSEVSFFSGLIDRFSDLVETVSIMTAENLGFTLDFQSALILIMLMLCVFIFSFADKILLRKNYK